MTRLDGWKRACAVLSLCTATAIAAPAQTFTTLFNFDFTDGALPMSVSPVQGHDGNLYGTTEAGGAETFGTVFKITPHGVLSTLYSFGSREFEGIMPSAGLALGADGNFYGTTVYGGSYNCNGGGASCGTVFKINPGGESRTLYRFCPTYSCDDGQYPYAALVRATDGNFYGTTNGGGAGGVGTVFKITPEGSLTTLHSFNWTDGNGAYPFAALVQATDGNLYGTTFEGGAGNGTVFKMTTKGGFTVLHRFAFKDGRAPYAGLIQADDGNFYGTTAGGGSGTNCVHACGTVFRMTPDGTVTTLHSFNLTDGAYPWGTLVQATDGSFYGTTTEGGDLTCGSPYYSGCGTLFVITPDGTFTTLHIFNGTDGSTPYGGMTQATNGILYGATEGGGGYGTLFSLDMGLDPFVAFVRDSGKVGGSGGILGQGFKGTTDVSLNGTPVDFTAVSDTSLKATVPTGATTGFVTVTTPSGTLTSNKPFRVRPQLLSFDPPNGPVGTQVTITGVSLAQTQGVGFGDRVPAQFTVNSDTQVTATVAAGAKTGKIGIETKGGTAISSGTFTVTP